LYEFHLRHQQMSTSSAFLTHGGSSEWLTAFRAAFGKHAVNIRGKPIQVENRTDFAFVEVISRACGVVWCGVARTNDPRQACWRRSGRLGRAKTY
jgi:hypothetical protein